jgi:hypothetical protein
MAIVTPPRTPWPGAQPVGQLEPGCDIFQADIEALILAQHWQAVHGGIQHLATALPECRIDAAGPIVVLTLLAYPRASMTGFRVLARVDSDDGCTVAAECVEDAVSDSALADDGEVTCLLDLVGVSEGIRRVRISLALAGASTYARLLAVSCVDSGLGEA